MPGMYGCDRPGSRIAIHHQHPQILTVIISAAIPVSIPYGGHLHPHHNFGQRESITDSIRQPRHKKSIFNNLEII